MVENQIIAAELKKILKRSIPEFRGLLNENDANACLLEPDKFACFHEFAKPKTIKGGILVIGLKPHLGINKTKDSPNSNPCKIENENNSEWREKFKIDEKTNTSNCLLLKYPYFKFFTESGGKLNLREINPGVEFTDVRFTDVILILSVSKKQLMCILRKKQVERNNDLLDKAICIGWKYYLKNVLQLMRPNVMVSNSSDLSSFLEKNCARDKEKNKDDTLNVKLDGFDMPCVLSRQVTCQRATDKWAPMRLKNSIKNAIRK